MSQRIEICGNIASGKTTLAKAFCDVGYSCIFEDFSKIAFLDDFYKNPTEYAFETEIAFTLQHYYQIKKNNADVFISDFSLFTDYVFALTTLTKSEFDIYEKLFEKILNVVGLPERIILLETPIEVLLNRINRRGRNNEQSITREYLDEIQNNSLKVFESKFIVKIVSLDTSRIGQENYDSHFLKSLLAR